MVLYQGRIVFKLQEKLFQYMALLDDRQRVMPTHEDRERGMPLAYPEAVLLNISSLGNSKSEVDDKYQYSTEDKDNRVHGWICSNPATRFWMITPSNEFRTARPLKQDLTSHVGPTTLSMFISTHYAGKSLGLEFEDGEPWKKVFGPVFIYINSDLGKANTTSMWQDAKEQVSFLNGIIMGGDAGASIHGRFRIATENLACLYFFHFATEFLSSALIRLH